MFRLRYHRRLLPVFGAILVVAVPSRPAEAACCLVGGKGQEVHQPAQKVFLDWDAKKKIETLVLQPSFEGDTPDFGIVIPTPAKPEILAVPREFFMELAVFTTLARRTFPTSRLKDPPPDREGPRRAVKVKVLAEGIVGTRHYRIVTSEQPDELVAWLKDNHYEAARDVFDGYVKKKWCFTLLQNNPAGTRKQADGVFAGEVQPIGLRFASKQPVYPLRAARPSVKDQLDVLFYVQAPAKMDLPGAGSFLYQWAPMLLNSRGVYPKGSFPDGDLPGKGDALVNALGNQAPALLKKGKELGFGFINKMRPQPNKQGRTATTLEWAKRLTADDLRVLANPPAYSDRLPDPDEGFSVADLKNDWRREAVFKVIQRRLDRALRDHPNGFLLRWAPAEDVARLKELIGRLHDSRFLTKFRKAFTREELVEDLVLGPARIGDWEDVSEYTEYLPASPP